MSRTIFDLEETQEQNLFLIKENERLQKEIKELKNLCKMQKELNENTVEELNLLKEISEETNFILIEENGRLKKRNNISKKPKIMKLIFDPKELF